VTFSPTSSGSKTAVLTITSNDPQSPHIINLAGSVLVPEIGVKYLGTPVASGGSITPSGTTPVGDYTDVTLTIENTGAVNLTVTADAMTEEFAIQTAPSSPVAPAGSTTVVVRFTGFVPGATAQTLTLQNNDDNEDPYTVLINMTAV